MANELEKIIVPPPAYVDPNNPAAAGGSINLSVAKHPLDISESYGGAVSAAASATKAELDKKKSETDADEYSDLKAGEWKDLVNAAEDTQELEVLENHYQASGANFTSVESALESKKAELEEGEDN